MGFLSTFFGRPNHAGVTPNANPAPASPPSVGAPDYTPGDPDGVDTSAFREPIEVRSFPMIFPSGWDGWPAEWSTPMWSWDPRLNALIDIAWLCIDLNARQLSAMPVYRHRGGQLMPPKPWMTNPDPSVYTSWHEFAYQLFRDFQTGEAFVFSMMDGVDGFPFRFRVIPPHMVDVQLRGGTRQYRIGSMDATADILHIRWDSSNDCPRSYGPLAKAGGRMVTAGMIEKYTREIVSSGGIDDRTLETADHLEPGEAQDLLNQYMTSRKTNLGAPPVLDGGATLKTHSRMSPKDMAMIEVAQFTENRIAQLLGVPGFLAGLPSGGDSLTYQNVSQLFDQHDRQTLRPMAAHVMGALSAWALPSTQRVELNRDEYSRPDFASRIAAYATAIGANIMSVEEVRAAERLLGDGPASPLATESETVDLVTAESDE